MRGGLSLEEPPSQDSQYNTVTREKDSDISPERLPGTAGRGEERRGVGARVQSGVHNDDGKTRCK